MTSKFYFMPNQQQCWNLIENNQDIELLYPDHMREKLDNPAYIKYMKSVLLPGEKYALLDDILYDYAITSFGRLINCKTQNQMFSQIALATKTSDIRISIRNTKTYMSKIFADQGWEFNLNEILKQHTNNI